MSTDDIEDRIREVLADVLGLDPGDITDQTSAQTVEEWDSLGHLTLVLSLEEEFDIAFDDEDTLVITNLISIRTIVRGKLGVGGAA